MSVKEIFIRAADKKHIAVIGGGFFGVLAALKLAEKGFRVTIIEKNKDILLGASYLNQNRMHMGYHYPRSDETAKSSLVFQKAFRSMFSEAVVDLEKYYCVAKKGSFLTSEQYKEFCDRIELPYEKKEPKDITISKEEIDLCIQVPEKMYDCKVLRRILQRMLDKEEFVTVRLNTEVTAISRLKPGFDVTLRSESGSENESFDVVVGASYSNLNTIAHMAGFETQEYQFELCEVPIVEVPWTKKIGFTIMDGPFCGIVPFGFSEQYMHYDVDISVLETSFGAFPDFEHDVVYHDEPTRRAERFQRYLDKAAKYVPEMAKLKHVYSTYCVRMVLKGKEDSDERPTEVLDHGDGFWSIFSGKVSNAIPASEKIVEEVESYFEKQEA